MKNLFFKLMKWVNAKIFSFNQNILKNFLNEQEIRSNFKDLLRDTIRKRNFQYLLSSVHSTNIVHFRKSSDFLESIRKPLN